MTKVVRAARGRAQKFRVLDHREGPQDGIIYREVLRHGGKCKF
jgi:hypothetical protein